MRMVGLELKKIYRRKSSKIAIFCGITLSFLFSILLALFGFSTNISQAGFGSIAQAKENAAYWSGPLTEENLYEAQQRYLEAYNNPNNLTLNTDGSTTLSNEAYEREIKPLSEIPRLLRSVFSPPGNTDPHFLRTMTPEQAARYYEQRGENIQNYLQNMYGGQDAQAAGDRAYWQQQSETIETPFLYAWYDGWYNYTAQLGWIAFLAIFIVCIAVSPVFSGEYQNGTDAILLCCRDGRGKLGRAKVLASLLLALVVYMAMTGTYFAGQLVFCGFAGWNSPVQLASSMALVPMNFLQLWGYTWLYGLAACVGMAGATAFFSSRMRNSFSVVILSLIVLLVPVMAPGIVTHFAGWFIDMLPSTTFYAELMRINLYHPFRARVWTPVYMVAAQFLWLLLLPPFAVLSYKKHQVKSR